MGHPKDLKTRLGVRDRLAPETADDDTSILVPKNGRHFTGLVSGVDMHKPFCWVVPDGQPAGTKHYLLYEDLPYGFEVSSTITASCCTGCLCGGTIQECML